MDAIQRDWRGLTGYSLLAVAIIVGAQVLFHAWPVAYTYVITEDQGEYAAAVGFGLAGLLLVGACLRARTLWQRLTWLTIAAAALVLAIEEVSWGERILRGLFGWSMPTAVRDQNLQGEFNLHNLEAVKPTIDLIYRIGPAVLLVWLGVSAWVELARPTTHRAAWRLGIPLVPLALIPMFLLPVYFLLVASLARFEELAETMLGVAAALFALEVGLRCRRTGGARGLPRAGAVAGLLAVVVVGTVALALASRGGGLRYRINHMAAVDYPAFGMMAQADTLFAHIDAHPSLAYPETPVRRAELLLARGDQAAARALLTTTASALEQAPPPDDGSDQTNRARADRLDRLGRIYTLLDDPATAAERFDQAARELGTAIAGTTGADQRAELLWSLAETTMASGRADAATAIATEAITTADSARLRRKIGAWIAAAEPAPSP